MRAVLRALARVSAQPVSKSTLLSDVEGEGRVGEAPVKARATLDRHLDYLERSFVVESQPAWNPALRSPVRLRSRPKRHFVDPSLAVAAMGATASMLRGDANTLGLLFESLCYRDLSIYASCLDARVLRYCDNAGLEVGAIVEMPDGSWGAFEVKLGADQVDKAAATLLALESKMANGGQGAPLCKCVIVGQVRYAARREDGVDVVPLSMLCA